MYFVFFPFNAKSVVSRSPRKVEVSRHVDRGSGSTYLHERVDGAAIHDRDRNSGKVRALKAWQANV